MSACVQSVQLLVSLHVAVQKRYLLQLCNNLPEARYKRRLLIILPHEMVVNAGQGP